MAEELGMCREMAECTVCVKLLLHETGVVRYNIQRKTLGGIKRIRGIDLKKGNSSTGII